MSEVIGTATIYGTYADAALYVADRYGSRYTAWTALSVAVRKQTLVSAADLLNAQAWIDEADTFAERDAIQAFKDASYEIGVLLVEDEDLTNVTDQGGNIQAANAGGAGVTFFSQTSSARGSAPVLPPIIMRLVGSYLAASATGGPSAPSGQSGSCRNPFSDCSDYDRGDP